MNDFDLWTSARSLWIKFCGIADEYKMLRDRWLYLHSKNKLPVLPYLRAKNPNDDEQTFDLLDRHVEKLEKLFEDLGFSRDKMENYNEFKLKVRNLDRIYIIDNLKLIEEYVYDLVNFVGLLKFAFFQRTVSSEIPHVASGMPHSPERTIGNELFYLAADNVARRYYECLRIPYGKWDGFITFTPPIEEEYFYGAFYRPSSYLRLFHISMSEESKYFVGNYLTLSHEFAHGCIAIRRRVGSKVWIDKPLWFKVLTGLICYNTQAIFENDREYICEYCPLYRYLFKLSENNLYGYSHLCEELLSDIIACYIAGKNYVHSFLDTFFYRISSQSWSLPILLRVIPTTVYFDLLKYKVDDLKQRIESITLDTEKIWGNEEDACLVDDYSFYECIFDIGIKWAIIIKEYNDNLPEIIFRDLEEKFYDAINQFNILRGSIDELQFKGTIDAIDDQLLEISQNELNNLKKIIDSKWSNLFNSIIRNKFKIKKNKEKEIISALIEGTPVPEEDPRHILHCYYEAYKQSEGEERPNYAATIYSLAFNTYINQNNDM